MSVAKTSGYFGSTEIAAHNIIERNACELAEHRDFVQDLVIALVLPATGSLWGTNWPDKLAGIIVPAYPLYLHASSNPDRCEQLLKLQQGRPLKRLHRKPEFLAVKAVAQPQDEAQDKCCSAYAIMFKWAARNRMTPEQFKERSKAVTLSQCRKDLEAAKAQERHAQQAEGASAAQPQPRRETLTLTMSSEGGGMALNFSLGIKTERAMMAILKSSERSLPVLLAQMLRVVRGSTQ